MSQGPSKRLVLGDLDAKLDSISKDVLPLTPFILRLKQSQGRRLPVPSQSIYWQRATSFKAEEQELQYLSFRQVQDGILYARGQWDDGEGGLARAPKSVAQLHEASTVETAARDGSCPKASAVKKKISLADYKNRDQTKVGAHPSTPAASKKSPSLTPKAVDTVTSQHDLSSRHGSVERYQYSLESRDPALNAAKNDDEVKTGTKALDIRNSIPKHEKPSSRLVEAQSRLDDSHTKNERGSSKPTTKIGSSHISGISCKTTAYKNTAPSTLPAENNSSADQITPSDCVMTHDSVDIPPLLSPSLPNISRAMIPQLLSPTLPEDLIKAIDTGGDVLPQHSNSKDHLASSANGLTEQHAYSKPKGSQQDDRSNPESNVYSAQTEARRLKTDVNPDCPTENSLNINEDGQVGRPSQVVRVSGDGRPQAYDSGLSCHDRDTHSSIDAQALPTTNGIKSNENDFHSDRLSSRASRAGTAKLRLEAERITRLALACQHGSETGLNENDGAKQSLQLAFIVIENLVLQMLDVHHHDRSLASKAKSPDTMLWQALLSPLDALKEIIPMHEHFLGLILQLEGVIREKIRQHQSGLLRVYLCEPGSKSDVVKSRPAKTEMDSLVKDYLSNEDRANDAWRKGHAALWLADVRERYPQTWSRGQGNPKMNRHEDVNQESGLLHGIKSPFILPLSPHSTIVEIASFCLSLLSEMTVAWDIAWKPSINI